MANVKGTTDYFGPAQALRQKVLEVLREVFELYDFGGMDSAMLNELDILTSKYAGGDEIVKEMYGLSDQGKRKLGLRYDLTIPLAKVVASNPGIALPFRRYEMGKVFRDGPVKRGRLREFWQCDADVVGIAGPEAEAELLLMASEVFKRLSIPVMIKWNNRVFLGELLEAVGIPTSRMLSVMLTLDKLDKIGSDEVMKELLVKGVDKAALSELGSLLDLRPLTFESLCRKYRLETCAGAKETEALQRLIARLGLGAVCRFDPFLSRGLSFYTGTVYEIFDATGTFGSSLGAGGRYDAIIGQLGGNPDVAYPTVGISFGMESILEVIDAAFGREQQDVVVVIPIGDTVPEALAAAAELRSGGVRTRLETSKRKLKRSLAQASAEGVRYVILIGEDEAAAGLVRWKDMVEMNERILMLSEAKSMLSRERAIGFSEI